jgi:ketosteroid isomerase-like protein
MSTAADILAVEEQRQKALVDLDMTTLDALFAEDLVHVHSNAMVHGKAELLAHIERNRAFVKISRPRLDVRTCGECAILAGPMTSLMRIPGGSHVHLAGWVTQVLRRDAGAWRFIAFQFTLEKTN